MTGVPGPFTPSVVCMTADAMPSRRPNDAETYGSGLHAMLWVEVGIATNPRSSTVPMI